MISRSINHYLQLGLLISYVGFSYAQDPLVQEYKAYADVIKGDILPPLKILQENLRYTQGVLDNRLARIESLIKNELGDESLEAFNERTDPLKKEYRSVSSEHYNLRRGLDYGDLSKVEAKLHRLEKNPDLKKLEKLDHLSDVQRKIKEDLNTQRILLNKVNDRLDDPDAYLAAMNQKTYSAEGQVAIHDPVPYFLQATKAVLQHNKQGLNDVGADPMETWTNQIQGYSGRSTISQDPRIIDFVDSAVQYSMARVDDALQDEYQTSSSDLYNRLGLGSTNKPDGPMYSPLEPAISQRVAAYFAPRMQQIGAWWNQFTKFTSNWFARTPNRFTMAKTMRMPKLQQPRIVGPKIENIDVYEQWK